MAKYIITHPLDSNPKNAYFTADTIEEANEKLLDLIDPMYIQGFHGGTADLCYYDNQDGELEDYQALGEEIESVSLPVHDDIEWGNDEDEEKSFKFIRENMQLFSGKK